MSMTWTAARESHSERAPCALTESFETSAACSPPTTHLQPGLGLTHSKLTTLAPSRLPSYQESLTGLPTLSTPRRPASRAKDLVHAALFAATCTRPSLNAGFFLGN